MRPTKKNYPISVYIYLFFFKVTSKIFRSIVKALKYIQALQEGFWLGILRRESIADVTRFYYDKEDRYKSDSWNKKGFFAWEESVVDKYLGKCKRLMVLGAGGGREVLALLKSGFQVDGYECNRGLVQYGNQILEDSGFPKSIQYLEEDKVPGNRNIYDGIVLGWSVYSHIQGKNKRVQLLKGLVEKMHDTSYLVFSFWGRVSCPRHLKMKIKWANFFANIRRNPSLEDGEELTEVFGKYFTKEEIEKEIAEAGYSLIHFDIQEYGHAVAVKLPPFWDSPG